MHIRHAAVAPSTTIAEKFYTSPQYILIARLHNIWYSTARRRQAAAPRPWVQGVWRHLRQQMAVSAPPSRWLRGQPLHHARFEVGAAWGWRLQPQAVMDAGEEQHRRARLDGGRDHDKLPHRHGLLIQI